MTKIVKLLKMPLVNLFVLVSLNACSQIKIYDDPWCADAKQFGAECFYAISDKEFTLNKFEWDTLRAGQICSATQNPGEGFSHLKSAVEKLCADTNKCTPEQKAEVDAVKAMLNNFTKKMNTAQERVQILLD